MVCISNISRISFSSSMVIPPRIRALFFLIITIIVAAGVVFWMLFGDRGYLIIENDVPDSILGVLPNQQVCIQTPCRLSLPAGNYSLVFEKEGRYSISREIRINLFQENKIELHFEKKPALTYAGTLQDWSLRPDQAAPVYRDNLDETSIVSRLKKNILNLSGFANIQSAYYSPTGSGAILFGKETTSIILDTGGREISELIDRQNPPAWDDDGNLYFWSRPLTTTWELYMFDRLSGRISRISIFYNLSAPRIFAARQAILIGDQKNNYLLDRVDFGKTIILKGRIIQKARWDGRGENFLAQDISGNFFVYRLSRSTFVPLPGILSQDFDLLQFYDRDLIYVHRRDAELELLSYDIDRIEKPDRLDIIVHIPAEIQGEELKRIETAGKSIFLQFDSEVYLLDSGS